MNRQSAQAHKLVFEAIETIISNDTGSKLRWHHLHAANAQDFTGILHWGGDQDGSQAKGVYTYIRMHFKLLLTQ